MEQDVRHALETDRLIDITTTGRKSGAPHRIEIGFHNIEGEIYISGLPGRRDWFANLLAKPSFTFHLKQSAQADLSATATPVTDEARRRGILKLIVTKWRRDSELEKFVDDSPLVMVEFEEEVSA